MKLEATNFQLLALASYWTSERNSSSINISQGHSVTSRRETETAPYPYHIQTQTKHRHSPSHKIQNTSSFDKWETAVFANHGFSNSELYLLSDRMPAIQRLIPYSLGIPFLLPVNRIHPYPMSPLGTSYCSGPLGLSYASSCSLQCVKATAVLWIPSG